MKNVIYFATNGSGITQTQAAFIKNMCKEVSQQAQTRLDNINIENATVSLIGVPDSNSQISKGVDCIDFVKKDIEFISQAASLGAWLGEAIKIKQSMLDNIDLILMGSYDRYTKEVGCKMPDAPYEAKSFSESDILLTMEKEFVVKYLALEATASQYGKSVHPDGNISKMRKKANDIINKPSIANGAGRDLTITERSISVDNDEIEQLFFDMQNIQRTAQAELNKMKSEIKEKLDDLKRNEIAKAEASRREYDIAINQLNRERSLWHIAEKERISALKIDIPAPLKEIYDQINAMIG